MLQIMLQDFSQIYLSYCQLNENLLSTKKGKNRSGVPRPTSGITYSRQ
jgi:hypothetical protein